MTNTHKCLICGGTETQIVGTQDRKGKPLKVQLCCGCGLVALADMPSEAALDQWYASSYREDYKKTRRPKAKHVFRAGREAAVRIEFLKQLKLAPGASILDVGAGMGAFVYLANRAGFRARGLEPHKGYAEFGAMDLGLDILNASLTEADYDEASFDCISVHHVVEHLPDPIASLTKLRKYLKSSGVLIVEVPNILSRFHSPRGQFHVAHLYYFSPWTLEAAAGLAGFEQVSLAVKPRTHHLLGVYRPVSEARSIEIEKTDRQQVEVKLKNHTMLAHYLTAVPYLRPFQNIGQQLGEYRGVTGNKDSKTILDEQFG